MNYSVIIRTKNSENTIIECITNLKNQQFSPNEIIAVDSGSEDLTISFLKKNNIKIIYYPDDIEYNYSKAINLGVEQSKNKLILILSSHVELLNTHLVSIMKNTLLSEKFCKAVSVVRTNKRNNNLTDDIKFDKIDISNFKGHAMYNFCSLIEKKSWVEYKFNEAILRCEDQDWAFHFLNKGYYTKILKFPNVYYSNPHYNFKKDLWDFITLGESVYPYLISNKFLLELLKDGLNSFFKGKMRISSRYFSLFVGIFRHKYLKKENIKSVYNKTLK